ARLPIIALREAPALFFRFALFAMKMKRCEKRRRQIIYIPPELAREAVDLRAARGEYVDTRSNGKPPVPQPRDAFERVFVVACRAPDRDRFPGRPRLDADFFQTKISPLEGHAVFPPEAPHELDRLVEAARSPAEWHAARFELLLREFELWRGADADDNATAGDDVNRRERMREQDGISETRDERNGTDFDFFRLGRERGHDCETIGVRGVHAVV